MKLTQIIHQQMAGEPPRPSGRLKAPPLDDESYGPERAGKVGFADERGRDTRR